MKKIKRLPESELEIMQIIWKEEAPVSRMTIEHALQERHPLAPTTILTLLTRLCEKGFLSLKKEGRPNLYEPLVTEREYSPYGAAVGIPPLQYWVSNQQP